MSSARPNSSTSTVGASADGRSDVNRGRETNRRQKRDVRVLSACALRVCALAPACVLGRTHTDTHLDTQREREKHARNTARKMSVVHKRARKHTLPLQPEAQPWLVSRRKDGADQGQ
jgi:hypothetical protein